MGGHGSLTILGSGTAVPRASRATSCYVLDDGAGHACLIDLGPGALHRAAAAGYDLPRLDAVYVTHIHPDHSADLVALMFALGLPLREPAVPLPVFGHPALRLLGARLRNAWPRWLAPGAQRLQLHDVSAPGELAAPAGWRAEAWRVRHHESSWGYRFTLPDGFTVAFSGDASEGESLEDLGREVDLFVLEAAAPDDHPVPGHLTPRRAGRVAAACGARHLVLTHFYPEVEDEPIEDQVRESFEGGLTLAQDGEVLALSR